MPPTMGLNAGTEATRTMREILLRHPEILTVVSQHGRPDNGSDASPFSNVELFCPLKNFDQWPAGLTKDKLTAQLQDEFAAALPGVIFNFSQYIQDNVEEALSGVKGANSVKILGPNLDVLEQYAGQILHEMQQVPGMADLGIFHIVGQPNLNIRIDRAKGSTVAEAQVRIAHNIRLPTGYRIVWAGEFQDLQTAKARLAIFVPLSLGLILILLYSLFNSLRDSLLALAGIPFAIGGGVLALFISGQPFSVSAAIGFISLFGVSTMNGILVITYFNQLRLMNMNALEAMAHAAEKRMRPMLMTALSACIGLVPAAFSHGIGSQVQRPLATVVVGGMLLGPIMLLVVVPALQLVFLREEGASGDGSPPPDARRSAPSRPRRRGSSSPMLHVASRSRESPAASSRRLRGGSGVRHRTLPSTAPGSTGGWWFRALRA
jgi:Cu/Ag efflux pump CusA